MRVAAALRGLQAPLGRLLLELALGFGELDAAFGRRR